MNLHYREIQLGDLPAIFEVRIAAWHNDNGREELVRLGITPESVSRMLGQSHRGWLCEADGRIVGFAMGNRESGELWVIAVLKEFESRGIGKRLLTLVEEWLHYAGWSELWLTTDTDDRLRAVGFYRHLGWTDWKIENGDRYMKKRLTSGEG
jgi:ribosomal protein S18 acetylase RimI-like enzyme